MEPQTADTREPLNPRARPPNAEAQTPNPNPASSQSLRIPQPATVAQRHMSIYFVVIESLITITHSCVRNHLASSLNYFKLYRLLRSYCTVTVSTFRAQEQGHSCTFHQTEDPKCRIVHLRCHGRFGADVTSWEPGAN